MSLPIHSKYDVVVIGGGPAGAAAALALVKQGVSVLIIERSDYQRHRFGETFPPAIQETLAQLGLWQEFLAANHLRSVGIRSVWGSNEPYDQSFLFNPYTHGWHVDRRAFDALVARKAQERGAELVIDSSLVKCERSSDGGWKLLVSSGDKVFGVRANFVVDAAGRTCGLARNLGRRRVTYDRLVGIYGLFTGNGHSDAPFTLVEAVEDGWWYSAPLPGGCHVVAFMTDSDLCVRMMMRNIFHWKARLDGAPHIRTQVAPLEFGSKLHVLPASSSHLDRACGRGWLAIGDAASSFDPLSGDGVLRALKSGLEAAEVILSCLAGDDSVLQEYRLAVAREFRLYLQQRNTYYKRESRWASAPFWSRRQKPPVDAALGSAPGGQARYSD